MLETGYVQVLELFIYFKVKHRPIRVRNSNKSRQQKKTNHMVEDAKEILSSYDCPSWLTLVFLQHA